MKRLSNIYNILNKLSPKQRLEYIWDYYKWHGLIFFFFLFMLISIIHSNLTTKERALEGVFINDAFNEDALSDLEINFMKDHQLDTSSFDVFFDNSIYISSDISGNSYNALQILVTRIVSGTIDFVVGDIDFMNELAYGEYFYDLTQILSSEQLNELSPYLFYIDGSLIDALHSDDIATSFIYPDPTKPELMTDPVPIFINIDKCENLCDLQKNSSSVIGITVNAPNLTTVLYFIDYLFL